MPAYKAFFKVIYKNLTVLMIYIAVFIFLAIALENAFSSQGGGGTFADAKVNVVFINYDEETEIVKGLRRYMEKNANIVDIPNNTEKLQDALFFREAEYIVRVPKGFSEGLIRGERPQLENTSLPASHSRVYIDNMLNKYLNTVKAYITALEGVSQAEMIRWVEIDLEQKISVNLIDSQDEQIKDQRRTYYFNYMAYSIFAVLILGVCTVMIVFNNQDLRRRNLCTPVKLKYMNFQLVLGSISFALLTWLVMVAPSFIFYGSSMLTVKGLLHLLNSLIFTVAALSISYLLGNILKSRSAMSGAANVFALGSSFIGGVFVPQELLGSTVQKIASFTPSYWYVKSNNIISGMDSFTAEGLRPVFLNMLVIIGFAVAMLSLAMVMIKQRRVSD